MFTTRNPKSARAARQTDFKEGMQVIIGCAMHPTETRRWLRFLKAHPPLSNAPASPVALLGKIHRPYLSSHLNCAQRVEQLITHYDILLNAGFGPLLRQALAKPLVLCSFVGKSGAPYTLQLSALEPGRQDGELALRLMTDDTCIYTIAFVVAASGSGSDLKVGGLKGVLSTGQGPGVKQVTRDLYGCRPKDLMVALARDLGTCFGCGKMLLTGNRNRIPERDRHVCRKSSDYDLTWKEMQATPRDDGDYELPCASADESMTRLGQQAAGTPNPVTPTRRSVLLKSIRNAVRANVIAHRSATRYIFTSPPAPMMQEEVLERLHM